LATARITKTSVDGLVTSGSTQFLWDDKLKGFAVRVTPNGAKSYVYQYRMGGRESGARRYTIGGHGSPWTPNTARDEAERLAHLVGRGIDPIDSEKERRRQAVDLAFAAYVEAFADGYLKERWTRWEAGKRLLHREVASVLGSKPLPLIKRSDLNPVWENLRDRPAVARLTHATLRKLFRWAVGRGDIERSPLEGSEAPPAVTARDRVLTDEEIALAWKAAGEIGAPFKGLYRLLIATGQRREEVAGLDWRELDRQAKLWTLPGVRAKNDETHLIPLSDLAIIVIDEIAGKVNWPRRGLVFSTTGKTAVSGFSKAKSRLDASMATTEAKLAAEQGREVDVVPAWRVHDIRRTVATRLQRLGVRFEVTEAVLNHISGSRSGIAGVYQRYDWAEEKRAALEAWASHIGNAIGASL